MRSTPSTTSSPTQVSHPGAPRHRGPRGRWRLPASLAGLAGVVTIALLVGACSPPSATDAPDGDTSTPNGGTSDDPATEESSASSRAGTAPGVWGVDAPGQPRLDLDGDGRFAGTDGCNRLFGAWTEDAGTVLFSEVGSTRMACPDVDTWLERLHSGHIDGDVLRISDSDGTEIGTLERVH